MLKMRFKNKVVLVHLFIDDFKPECYSRTLSLFLTLKKFI